MERRVLKLEIRTVFLFFMEMLGATVGTREQKNKLYMQIKTLCNAARVEAFNEGLEIGLQVKENE